MQSRRIASIAEVGPVLTSTGVTGDSDGVADGEGGDGSGVQATRSIAIATASRLIGASPPRARPRKPTTARPESTADVIRSPVDSRKPAAETPRVMTAATQSATAAA